MYVLSIQVAKHLTVKHASSQPSAQVCHGPKRTQRPWALIQFPSSFPCSTVLLSPHHLIYQSQTWSRLIPGSDSDSMQLWGKIGNPSSVILVFFDESKCKYKCKREFQLCYCWVWAVRQNVVFCFAFTFFTLFLLLLFPHFFKSLGFFGGYFLFNSHCCSSYARPASVIHSL